MTTYRIISKRFAAAVIVNGGMTIQAAPVLTKWVGRDFSELRDYASSCGWAIEPLQRTSDWIEDGFDIYEVKWSLDRTRILRVSLHANGDVIDKSFDELPKIVKDALL